MAVRIRMKRMGRRHRPFFRVVAADGRSPRDGRVIEELGYYDPMIRETDARAVLKSERIDYWLGVGAQPSDNVKVLIKKYGTAGTHLEQQRQAFERLKMRPELPPAVPIPLPEKEQPAAEETPAAEEAPVADDAPAVTETPAAEETPAVAEAPAAEEKPAVEEASAADETPSSEPPAEVVDASNADESTTEETPAENTGDANAASDESAGEKPSE